MWFDGRGLWCFVVMFVGIVCCGDSDLLYLYCFYVSWGWWFIVIVVFFVGDDFYGYLFVLEDFGDLVVVFVVMGMMIEFY